MAELLIFAWDHATQSTPTPSDQQIAVLPKRFDMVTAQADGWNWGTEELANPIFRIISWPSLSLTDVEANIEAFLANLPHAVDADLKPTTHGGYRAFFMDLDHPVMSEDFRVWLADDSRVTPMYTVTLPSRFVTTLRSARSRVALES